MISYSAWWALNLQLQFFVRSAYCLFLLVYSNPARNVKFVFHIENNFLNGMMKFYKSLHCKFLKNQGCCLIVKNNVEYIVSIADKMDLG